ncbi:hypothetical protein HK101_006374 [Irineochytrium annulatum]|nr:hypothetical protein HK101_006374 [Irineochytrium annulatum]
MAHSDTDDDWETVDPAADLDSDAFDSDIEFLEPRKPASTTTRRRAPPDLDLDHDADDGTSVASMDLVKRQRVPHPSPRMEASLLSIDVSPTLSLLINIAPSAYPSNATVFPVTISMPVVAENDHGGATLTDLDAREDLAPIPHTPHRHPTVTVSDEDDDARGRAMVSISASALLSSTLSLRPTIAKVCRLVLQMCAALASEIIRGDGLDLGESGPGGYNRKGWDKEVEEVQDLQVEIESSLLMSMGLTIAVEELAELLVEVY